MHCGGYLVKFVPVGVFVVCSAAYTGYTDADCNLDCVVVVVVAFQW